MEVLWDGHYPHEARFLIRVPRDPAALDPELERPDDRLHPERGMRKRALLGGPHHLDGQAFV
jgi:hypothetical protein